MNLESEISNIISQNNYDDFTKIRLIYLYVCKLFSYDTRFIYGNDDLKEKIYTKEIDISNVKDFEVVCYTLSRVLVDALNLYGFESQIIRVPEGKFKHAYVQVKCKDYLLKLDPTKRHDVTRVKMNSSTIDFNDEKQSPFFLDELKEADKIISNNFEKVDTDILYDSEKINQLVKIVEDSIRERNLSDAEAFFEKIQYIYSAINLRNDFTSYDDIDFYYAYLIKKFNLNPEIEINNTKKKINRVKPAIFFNREDKSMKDIINITLIEYDNLPPLFYLLKKEGNKFVVREIFKEEVIEYLNKYKSLPQVEYLFEKAVAKLSPQNGKIIF